LQFGPAISDHRTAAGLQPNRLRISTEVY